MNNRFWMLLTISFAIALGVFIPQLKTEQAKGSPTEVTYQFTRLGIDTTDALKEMEEALENIVGITHFEIVPSDDSVIVTFNEETMKAQWIAKSLEARGYPPKKYVEIKQKR